MHHRDSREMCVLQQTAVWKAISVLWGKNYSAFVAHKSLWMSRLAMTFIQNGICVHHTTAVFFARSFVHREKFNDWAEFVMPDELGTMRRRPSILAAL